MALVDESPLDQAIRLQVTDDFWAKNSRPPADEMGMRPNVTVRSVRYGGASYAPASGLLGAKVYLDGAEPSFDGPIFESRNNIVGNDDAMAFVVSPFRLRIQKSMGQLETPVKLRALRRDLARIKTVLRERQR